MPNYVEKTLEKLNHQPPNKDQHAPHRWVKPKYGVIQQLTPKEDTTEYLSAQDTNYIQKVVGSFFILWKGGGSHNPPSHKRSRLESSEAYKEY